MYRKLWAALIVLALILSPMTALADEASEAMPEIGGVLNGFALVDSRDFDLLNATVYRFEHERTGAEVIYIQNDDTNRMFDMSFHTRAIDNTGLPHVFEHAVTNGSDKYPSRDLFMNLIYGSYNTFMNAETGQNLTSYPVSSLSEDQLLKFADLYVDCCLHPMILKDEAIYRSEAWRYRLASPEDELTIEGTVYSEMLGATTLSRAHFRNVRRTALPGSLVGNDSGGQPEDIPDMTYEALRAYHDKYYHPSNSVTWLYGKLDRFDTFLQLLDDAFAPYERREFSLEDADYTPIAAPVEAEFPFPVEAGSQVKNAAATWYCFVCPGLKDDLTDTLIADYLSALMNDPSSKLSQAMREALPTVSFGAGCYFEGPDALFVFTGSNITREDAPTFKRIVDEGIADVVENGFADDLVDAVAASEEITMRLVPESSELGYNTISSMMYDYFIFGDPYTYIDEVEAVGSLRDWHESGRFVDSAKQWLADNPLTALVTTFPEPGLKERNDAALAERLAEVKANMSDAELNAIIEATNAQRQPDPDTAALAQSLTAVTVPTLPEEAREYPVEDAVDANGTRHINVAAETEDIAEVQLVLDASAMPQEDLHWMQLYTDLLLELDSAHHTREALSLLASRYLYGFGVNLYCGTMDKPFYPTLTLSWIGLDEDQPMAFDLLREILYETRYDDTAKLSENVTRMIADMRRSVNASSGDIAFKRAMGRSVAVYRYSEYLSGVAYFEFLNDVAAQLESDPEGVVASLERVRDYFDNATNAVVGVAGGEDSIALNAGLANAWLEKLDRRPVETVAYDLPEPAPREALIADVAVQFNFVGLGNDALGIDPYDPKLDVVGMLISDAYLTPMLRNEYGAYGTSLSFSNYGAYVQTYRDPNIAESFEVIDQLPEAMEMLVQDIDQESLDPYIMSVYTNYALSSGELSGAMSAMSNRLRGLPDDYNLRCMKALKSMTPEDLPPCVDIVRKLVEEGGRATFGGAAAINANAELFDSILNPFGAQE